MNKIRKLLEENQWSRRSSSLRDPGLYEHVQTCPVCTMLEKRGAHAPECWLGQAIAELEMFRIQLTVTLGWMVKDMVYRHNQTHDNLEAGSQGGYSEELTEAIKLLTELKGEE